jgi:hypothetical protein
MKIVIKYAMKIDVPVQCNIITDSCSYYIFFPVYFFSSFIFSVSDLYRELKKLPRLIHFVLFIVDNVYRIVWKHVSAIWC